MNDRSVLDVLRLRHEQIHPQSLREEPGDELPLDAVAGAVEWRRKRAEPALAGRDGDDAAADAALARQADLVEPIAGGLVEARGQHHGERMVAHARADDPLAGDRIDA